jgi:hypothetical protein
MADQEEEEPKFYMKGYKVEENQEERPGLVIVLAEGYRTGTGADGDPLRTIHQSFYSGIWVKDD